MGLVEVPVPFPPLCLGLLFSFWLRYFDSDTHFAPDTLARFLDLRLSVLNIVAVEALARCCA